MAANQGCSKCPGPSRASETRAARGATTEHSHRLCEGGATTRCDADRSTRRRDGRFGQPSQARDIIEGLREQIRRIERRPPVRAGHASSGREEIDALLPGGGFPRGALSELAGGPASGKTALALSALAAAMGEEGLGAYVDGRGQMYPPAAAALGLDLVRLLFVRPPGADGDPWSALWAAEALLGSGAFEAVVLDVPLLHRARAPGGAALETALQRLRAAAEKGGAVALWLSASDGPRVPAALRLELAAGRNGNEVRRTFARGARGAGPAAATLRAWIPSQALEVSHAA